MNLFIFPVQTINEGFVGPTFGPLFFFVYDCFIRTVILQFARGGVEAARLFEVV